MRPIASELIRWCNDNGGFVSVILFIVTLLFAWLSGLFALIRHRPRLKLSILPGPNFACVVLTGGKHNGYDVTRTFFALYLNVTNRGSAATTIQTVQLGYKWSINALNLLFLRYVIGWCWLRHPIISMTDFHVILKSGSAKFYPFLIQRSTVLPDTGDLFLPIGKSTHGVIYFEQRDAWGGCLPRAKKEKTLVKVCVVDSFGGKHSKKFALPVVPLNEARKFNPTIGVTHDELV